MDSQFQTWQLACTLYYYQKKVLKTECMTERTIKDSEPMRRIGTDQRTKDKYFKLLKDSGYIQAFYKKFTDRPDETGLFVGWTIQDDIEKTRPLSLKGLMEQYKSQ